MTDEVPSAEIVPAGRLPSATWLVPIAVLAIVGILVWQAIAERGIRISIAFLDGGSLRAGDPIVYRGLRVGIVRDVRLAEDLQSVVIEAELRRDAEGVAVEGSQFWIVRPEISLQQVSGLETLVGPRYIEVSPGPDPEATITAFDGLESAPRVGAALEGALEVALKAERRGSLNTGSPVLFRDLQVGHVTSISLAADGAAVDVGITIEPEYAALVRTNTRFWNASGIGVDFGWFAGLTVRTDSLEAILTGGIGFATPNRPGERVDNGATFDLAAEPDSDWLKWSPALLGD